MVVLHYTAMQDAEAATRVLCAPDREVSAHYLIARDGEIIRMVEEDARAWHAGASRWGSVDDINSRSIGIELDNDGESPFAEPLMAALERLLPGIMARHAIAPWRVVGHSDIAPHRKIDPGAHFDWRRLARAGLSVWPDETASVDIEANPDRFVRDAERFGYHAPDDQPDRLASLLYSFRLRFQPQSFGPLDATDCAMIADLAARFPVDRNATAT